MSTNTGWDCEVVRPLFWTVSCCGCDVQLLVFGVIPESNVNRQKWNINSIEWLQFFFHSELPLESSHLNSFNFLSNPVTLMFTFMVTMQPGSADTQFGILVMAPIVQNINKYRLKSCSSLANYLKVRLFLMDFGTATETIRMSNTRLWYLHIFVQQKRQTPRQKTSFHLYKHLLLDIWTP